MREVDSASSALKPVCVHVLVLAVGGAESLFGSFAERVLCPVVFLFLMPVGV